MGHCEYAYCVIVTMCECNSAMGDLCEPNH